MAFICMKGYGERTLKNICKNRGALLKLSYNFPCSPPKIGITTGTVDISEHRCEQRRTGSNLLNTTTFLNTWFITFRCDNAVEKVSNAVK